MSCLFLGVATFVCCLNGLYLEEVISWVQAQPSLFPDSSHTEMFFYRTHPSALSELISDVEVLGNDVNVIV